MDFSLLQRASMSTSIGLFLSSLLPSLPLSFLPPQLLLHLLLLSVFFQVILKSLCSKEAGWLPYPLSNLHTEVPPHGPASEEKKGEVMWEERKGNFPSSPGEHLRPTLKQRLLMLPFVSSPLFFFHNQCLYPSSKKSGAGRGGFEVPHWRRKAINGGSVSNQDK